jgi:hypothetical protein
MRTRSTAGFGALGYLSLLAIAGLASSTVYFAVQAHSARTRLREADPASDPAHAAAEPQSEASLRGTLWARDAEVARLSAENRTLRARLLGAPASAAPDAGAGRPWLEELKTRDPERYRRMMDRREQARLDRANEFQSALARIEQRLEAIPPEGRTPRSQKEAELLEQMHSALQQLEQLGDKFQQARQLPEAERGPALQALQQQGMELYGQVVALKQQDRQMQLEQLAGQEGIPSSNVPTFTQQVDQIVKETQPPSRRGFLGGPGGPGGAAGGSGTGGTATGS